MGIIIAIVVVIFCLLMLFDNGGISKTDDEVVFKSSFVRGGNLFFPEKLIFTENKVTLVRNHGSKDLYTSETKQTIPYNKITGINVVRNIIGCNIQIIGDGYQSIYATSYSEECAEMIEQFVNLILEENK